MYYIIIRYSNQCFAKQSYLFSSFFSLIFSLETTILEKSEKKIEKSEENKKKRQSSVENYRFFLAGDERFELPHTESESAVLPLHQSASFWCYRPLLTANNLIIPEFFQNASPFLLFLKESFFFSFLIFFRLFREIQGAPSADALPSIFS